MTSKLAYSLRDAAQAVSVRVRSMRYLMEIGKLRPVQIRLAQALGVQPHDIWPDQEPTA